MPEDNGLKTITAGELMDTQLPVKHQIVADFLPVGTYIVAGAPKIGKSFLMTQLCWCVSEGQPFLEYETQQADVLYLALEDTNVRLQERLNRMFGVNWLGTRLHLTFRTAQQGNNLIQQLENFVFEHPETRLIVIDTLQRARSNDDGNYSYANDYKDIQPFKEFSDARDLAMILVHHTRKNTNSTNPFDQISGTNGLLGAADGGFILHREKDEVFLDFTGRDLPPQRYELRFAKSNCQWELIRVDEPFFEKEPVPLLDWIDALVLDFWSGTATQLLDEIKNMIPDLEWKPNYLTRNLNILAARLEEDKGIIYRCRRDKDHRFLTFERTPRG